MILDESELTAEDTFEEITLNYKGHLSFIWILTGIIGFLSSVLCLYLFIEHPSHRAKEDFLILFLCISGIISFGLMSFWGFKSRDILNSNNKNLDIEKIPKYGIFIWLLIATYTIIIWSIFYFKFIN
ncbi:MAG: hypothetical protein ACI94Y_001543 [Maribacter sp.]|jgi:hypothetical protein